MPSGSDSIDAEVADKALSRLEIDALGLDAMDRRYLTMIADLYGGGPVGVETLAAGLSEPRDTIEDVIEPFLIQLGLIARTARGRCLNGRGYAHLGLPRAAGQPVADCSSREQRRMTSIVIPDLIRDPPSLLAAKKSWIPAFAGMTMVFARPQPRKRLRRARLFEGLGLAVPARPRRHLLDAAADDRAQSQRLWLERAAARSPRIRRSTASTSIRPSRSDPGMNSDMNAGPRGESSPPRSQFARFASVCRTVRAGLPPDDAGRGRRLCRRRATSARLRGSPIATSLAAWRNYLAHPQPGPAVRADRPQPGQPDAAAADRRARSRTIRRSRRG